MPGLVAVVMAAAVVAAGCDGDAGDPQVEAGAGSDGSGATDTASTDSGAGASDGAGGAADAGGSGGAGGGGGAGGDGGSAGTGGGGDASGPGTGGGGAVDAPADLPLPRQDGPRDMFAVPDARLPDGPPLPPISTATGKKLLPARSSLLGAHRSGCSHGEVPAGATATRWCAISRPGAQLGRLELWVLNVTAAAAPAGDVRCDGTSPHCLKLTDNLFAGQPGSGPRYPDDHRFSGDTLVFYANNLSGPSDLYQGPVYAWRPGWTAPRQIASSKGVLCSAHSVAPVATCVENISDVSAATVTWDLHAGNIESGPLKKVTTIYPVHPVTLGSQWAVAFDRKGETLMFSTPLSASGQEQLFFIKTANIDGVTPATLVGTPGASRWSVNAAGTKWFYLREYNYNLQGEPSGTLYMRDFPGGLTETPIRGSLIPGGPSRGVGVYHLVTNAMGEDAGIAFVAPVIGGRGDYRFLRNPDASYDDPANVVTLLRDISLRQTPIFSPDLRYVYYATMVNETVGTTNSVVARSDGTGACTLSQSLDSFLFGVPFLTGAGPVIWVDAFDAATDSGEGWLANPEGCTGKRRFAVNVDFWFTNGRDQVLYSDSSNGLSVTLRSARLVNGAWPDSTSTIGSGLARLYQIVGNIEGVLYQIDSLDPTTSGIYHNPL